MEDLNKLLKFTEFFHAFQQVKRATFVNGEDRRENDAEHCFQVAITAWYLIQSKKLNLDINLILKYALVHDLVEAYAGDTYIFDVNTQLDSKEHREKLALEKLSLEFNEMEDAWHLIHQYEMKTDEEAKFIYYLDKLLPVVNIYLDGGKTWQNLNESLEMVRNNKTPKMVQSKELYPYWQALLEIIEKNEDKLFNKKS